MYTELSNCSMYALCTVAKVWEKNPRRSKTKLHRGYSPIVASHSHQLQSFNTTGWRESLDIFNNMKSKKEGDTSWLMGVCSCGNFSPTARTSISPTTGPPSSLKVYSFSKTSFHTQFQFSISILRCPGVAGQCWRFWRIGEKEPEARHTDWCAVEEGGCREEKRAPGKFSASQSERLLTFWPR